jgi:hypothetical protein
MMKPTIIFAWPMVVFGLAGCSGGTGDPSKPGEKQATQLEASEAQERRATEARPSEADKKQTVKAEDKRETRAEEKQTAKAEEKGATSAEAAYTILHPRSLKVGQRGELFNYARGIITTQEDSYWYAVDEVLSDKEVLVRSGGFERVGRLLRRAPASVWFIVEMNTKGLADNQRPDLAGVWEVSGTKKIEKRTYHVLRPLKDMSAEKKEGKK